MDVIPGAAALVAILWEEVGSNVLLEDVMFYINVANLYDTAIVLFNLGNYENSSNGDSKIDLPWYLKRM